MVLKLSPRARIHKQAGSMQDAHLVMSSCRLVENWEGKKPGKYLWMNPKMRTCPTGVRGAIRMMVNGTNMRTSQAVRRSAWTSLGFNVWPASQQRLLEVLFWRDAIQHDSARTPVCWQHVNGECKDVHWHRACDAATIHMES